MIRRRTLGVLTAVVALGATAMPLRAVADDPIVVEPIDPGVQCTGDPPRQTADPLSPPCVAYWDGDNGCETYGLGVECDEVRIAVYLEGGVKYINGSDLGNQVTPEHALYDLWLTPQENQVRNGNPESQPEHLTVKGLRVWQEYFGQRFQTYGRAPHFFVYFSDHEQLTPEGRRADAAYVFEAVEPFAAVSFADFGGADDFVAALARKGVVNFGSRGLSPDSLFNRYPKMVWSYLPSAEIAAANYGDYVCGKVVNQAPVLAGTDLQWRADLENEGRRKLGLLYTNDPEWPGLTRLAQITRDRVESCGGTIEAQAAFANCCLAHDGGENPDYALLQMAEFKLRGITTILWGGGINGNYGKASATLGYRPEWIIAGDGLLDANWPVILSQNSVAFDGRAIVVTPQVFEPSIEERRCSRFFREIDEATPDSDVGYVCPFYPHLHQLFVGIQVSGPYLNPTSIDKGFHAIPQRDSADPTSPACFYLSNDYTCVKDAQAEIWDAQGIPPGETRPGCWRSIEGGVRYRAPGGDPQPWPGGNVDAQITGDEPCNAYSHPVPFRVL